MSDFAYKPHLDGLRGLSILLVVVSHAGLDKIVPGGLGVTVFFFISGYLIASLLLAEKAQSNTVNLPAFYLRRLWRLVPPIIGYVVLASLLVLGVNGRVLWMEPASVLFYFSNYYKLFVDYQGVGVAFSPFDIFWSLAVEEHFYLFFAPLLAFINNRKTLLAALVFLIVAPLAVRVGVTEWATADMAAEYSYRATDARLDSIAYGCLLALLGRNILQARHARLWVGLGLLGLLTSLLYRDAYFRQVWRYSFQGVCLFLIIGPMLLLERVGPLRRFFSHPALVYVGKLSYSIYLYHWLALVLVEVCLGRMKMAVTWQLFFWGATVMLSMASFYLVERPSMRLRRKFGSNV